MNIVQVVPYFFPAWRFGGPAKLVYDTSSFFATKGHQVVVLTTDAYDEVSRMPEDKRIKDHKNLKVFYSPVLSIRLAFKVKIFFSPSFFWQALKNIPQAEIVHIHDFFTPHTIWAAIVAKIYKKPYILSVHGTLEEKARQEKSFFKKFFLVCGGRWVIKNASRLIASGRQETSSLAQGANAQQIVRIEQGINTAELESKLSKAEARKKFKLPSSSTIFTFVGRIHRLKGLGVLIDAVNFVKDEDVLVVIAGTDDGYLAKLEEKISSLHLQDKFLLRGPIFGTEKADLYKASDVFVYPSLLEGFSLAILEAGAAGLPLLITTACHFPEVAKVEAGLVTKPNAKKLASALNQFLADKEFRHRCSLKSRELIKSKYSEDVKTKELLSLYQICLKEFVQN